MTEPTSMTPFQSCVVYRGGNNGWYVVWWVLFLLLLTFSQLPCSILPTTYQPLFPSLYLVAVAVIQSTMHPILFKPNSSFWRYGARFWNGTLFKHQETEPADQRSLGFFENWIANIVGSPLRILKRVARHVMWALMHKGNKIQLLNSPSLALIKRKAFILLAPTFSRHPSYVRLSAWLSRTTEHPKSVSAWLREVSSCSCLTLLPGPVWVLLGK